MRCQLQAMRIMVVALPMLWLLHAFFTPQYFLSGRRKLAELNMTIGDALSFRPARNSSASIGGLHARWIVVTTVQEPTWQMRRLASLPGWSMVVVGDRKTPEGWSLPGVTYLSPRDQENLGYAVLDYIPYNSYSRKIVGYLFAIQHGAHVIYETDDDNGPDSDLGDFDEPAKFTINTTSTTYNPCPHFGQSSMWPRGYPLDQIGVEPPFSYRLCESSTDVWVKQGMVNGDPDVDAIFRLTRKHASARLNLTFDGAAPPVALPPGTFAPYNCQNTALGYGALWSLVLPRTVTFRVTDIWRAYWAQPLLWRVGGRLAFFAPRATQLRNAHGYIADAEQEADLYVKTPALVAFLAGWSCKTTLPHDDLPACAMQLTVDMVNAGFWGAEEILLYHAWMQDLIDIGYRFPELLQPNAITDPCRNSANVTCYPNEQPTSANYQPALVQLGTTMRKPFCSEIQ